MINKLYIECKLLLRFSIGVLKWFVDGSHNVHWDYKGHGGAMFTMGKGVTSSYLPKMKLN